MAIEQKNKNKSVIEKDSPIRSISKALSWRVIASITTWLIMFVIFRRYTDKPMDEAIEKASLITSIEVVAKLIFYYLHERLWTNIKWGKYWYWQRKYWRSKAWRKMYNDKHEQANQI